MIRKMMINPKRRRWIQTRRVHLKQEQSNLQLSHQKLWTLTRANLSSFIPVNVMHFI